jgi:hypothetical protein
MNMYDIYAAYTVYIYIYIYVYIYIYCIYIYGCIIYRAKVGRVCRSSKKKKDSAM